MDSRHSMVSPQVFQFTSTTYTLGAEMRSFNTYDDCSESGYRLSLEFTSIRRFVISTSPRTCVHSETMLPTTCPHFSLGFMCQNAQVHPAPVMSRKIVNECSRKNSSVGEHPIFFNFLLS